MATTKTVRRQNIMDTLTELSKRPINGVEAIRPTRVEQSLENL